MQIVVVSREREKGFLSVGASDSWLPRVHDPCAYKGTLLSAVPRGVSENFPIFHFARILLCLFSERRRVKPITKGHESDQETGLKERRKKKALFSLLSEAEKGPIK